MLRYKHALLEMDISIIICTRNRASDLRSTLQSLASTTVPAGLKVECIVIDNNSSDETQRVIADFDAGPWVLREYVEEAPGLSHARNRAIHESRGDVLLFTDDDVRVPEAWIDPMTRPIRMGEADAVAGGIKIAPGLRRAWMTPRSRSVLADTCLLDPDQPQYFVGANMAIGRHVFETIPGFDPEIDAGPNSSGFAGDVLFARQMLASDFEIAGALDVEVEHHFDPDRLSRESYIQAMRKQGQSEAYLDYHWRHRRPEEIEENLWVALAKALVRLNLERVKRFASIPAEGMEIWEMRVLTRFYRIQTFLRERKRPRNYDQYGTRKKHGVPLQTVDPSLKESVL